MLVDVVALLEEGLRSAGRESLVVSELDAHSTIALDFTDAPSILIDQIEGDVWFSTNFEISDVQWEAQALAILESVSEQSGFIASRAPCVFKRQGAFDLYALVNQAWLNDAQSFMRALEGFQLRSLRLREVIS